MPVGFDRTGFLDGVVVTHSMKEVLDFQGLSLEVKSFCPPQAPEDWIRDLIQENTNWDPTHSTQHHANGQLGQ